MMNSLTQQLPNWSIIVGGIFLLVAALLVAVLIFVLKYGRRISLSETTIELVKLIVPLIVSVPAAVWIVATYFHQSGIQENQKKVEISEQTKRGFYERQLVLCLEASRVAAQLASTRDPAVWKTSRARFWELYWGELAVVEDQGVASKTVNLGKKLASITSQQEQELDAMKREGWNFDAIDIARACRSLVAQSWKVELGTITIKTQ